MRKKAGRGISKKILKCCCFKCIQRYIHPATNKVDRESFFCCLFCFCKIRVPICRTATRPIRSTTPALATTSSPNSRRHPAEEATKRRPNKTTYHQIRRHRDLPNHPQPPAAACYDVTRVPAANIRLLTSQKRHRRHRILHHQ